MNSKFITPIPNNYLPAPNSAFMLAIWKWLLQLWRFCGACICGCVCSGRAGRWLSSCLAARMMPPAPNRAAARLEQRALPAARQGCALDGILYRVHGRAYYLRWIYDYGLSGRVRWCFMDWNWRWPARICFAGCSDCPKLYAVCHAPLFPD